MNRFSPFLLFVLSVLCSCNNNRKTNNELDISSAVKIDVSADISEDEIGDFLELGSYIPLSNEVLIDEVKRVIISNDLVYILDDEPKIVCFDLKGKLLFVIDDRGPGPTEYQNIRDIAIDGELKRLIAFDNEKRKLFFFDLKTGAYLSDNSTEYMAPTEIAHIGNGFFFKNIDVRFKVQEDHQFYLLYSQTGEQVDSMYLPHDAVSDFNFDLESFFYNDGNLLFIRPFDHIVYRLRGDGEVIPVFEINLPNLLPMRRIEEKISHLDVIKSNYSFGIGDVYLSNGILHFTYTNNGFFISTFYNLSSNMILYNGMRVLGDAREKLPLYSMINGVYEDKFFALVSASSIVERRKVHPKYFHGELSNIKEDDNAVLAFFRTTH